MPEEAGANLEFVQLEVRPPPAYTAVWELAFDLVSTGSAKAVLRTIRLVVDESHASDTLRLAEAGAPVVLHHYRVRLTPETREVDIRGRVFGAPVEPRAFPPEEVESFLVDVSSSRGYIYRCRLVADWYEARRPNVARQSESPSFTLDFPPEPEELLQRAADSGQGTSSGAPAAAPGVAPFQRHLPAETITALHKAAVESGLASSRSILLSGMAPAFVAGLPTDSIPSAQLLSDLNALNAVEFLGDGSVPLRQWLAAARALAATGNESAVFASALAAMGATR